MKKRSFLRFFSFVLTLTMLVPMMPIMYASAAEHGFMSGENLALGATATASSNESGYGPEKTIDGDFSSSASNRWAEKDYSELGTGYLRLTWSEAVTFDVIYIVESVTSWWSERIDGWSVTISSDGETFDETPIASGNGLGNDYVIQLDSAVTAKAIQINILSKLESALNTTSGKYRGANLAEVAVYSTIEDFSFLDGTNYALSAAASASTYYNDTYAPSKVNDGTTGGDNRWSEKDKTADGSTYFRLSWDTAVTFDVIYIIEFVKASWGLTERAGDWSVTASDDGENFDEAPIAGGSGIGTECVVRLDKPCKAKAIQLNILTKLDGMSGKAINLSEMSVYYTKEGEAAIPEVDEESTDMAFLEEKNIALSSSATASSYQGSYAPAKAIDGTFSPSGDNRWAPKDKTDSQWFMLEWEEKIGFDIIRMGEPTSIGDPRADEYTVYISNDGVSFTAIYTGNGIGSEKIIRFKSPISAKYLKIEFTSFLHATNRPNLSEIQVYNTYGGTRLKGFEISGVSTYIDLDGAKVNILLSPGENTVFTPVITVPEGSTVSPTGEQDFSESVVYTVTDPYGASRDYTVSVSYYINDSELTENSGAAVLPWGALPNTAQYKYQKDELAAFCHFGMNTMTGKEWGSGKESPEEFTLTESIDADSYIKLLKEAGFSRVILTVKHHDGFCLWDSKYTTHDIASTNYKGDIIAEFSAACTKYDMPMGIYLSPWDENQAYYGSYGYKDADGNIVSSADEDVYKYYYGEGEDDYFIDYNDYYAAQVEEICSNPAYGNNGYICEFWFDGAKGTGELSAPAQSYDYPRFKEIIDSYEPDCIIMCGSLGDMSTAGNETGRVNEEYWALSGGGSTVYDYNKATCGSKYGDKWVIREADGMTTHAWFGGEDSTTTKNLPKELTYLRDVYRYSVGRGTTLLLNVPLNKYGTLDTAVAERVKEWGENVQASYVNGNLLTADSAKIYVDSVYENAAELGPAMMTDGDDSTYWASASQNAEILIKLNEETTFDVVMIEEAIQLGQRVEAFEIYYKNDLGEWIEFFHGTTICGKRIAQSQPVTSSEIKIALHGMTSLEGVGACPVISALGIYKTTKAFELAPAAPLELSEIDNSSESFSYEGFETVEDKEATSFSCLKGGAGATLTATFEGTFARLAGQLEAGASVKVSLDGGAAQTVSSEAVFTLANSAIFETGTVSDGSHTITLEVISGNVTVDTLYVLNNGGAGFAEFEKDVINTPEDCEVNVKLIRRGGSVGTLSLTLNVSDALGLSDANETYDITFASGETEKTLTFNIGRNTEKTGTQSFWVAIAETEISGFISSIRIDVLDTEDYDTTLLSANIAAKPNKQIYAIGESLDISGMVIEGVFAVNPTWHTLYEDNGIYTSEKAEKFSESINFRRDTLNAPILAGALRLNIFGLQKIDVFSKPNISEIEVYNGTDNTNLALAATADARSESTWDTGSNKVNLNDGDIFDSWVGAWASDYPIWGSLTWDKPTEFDTVDIYEYCPSNGVGDFYVDALVYDKATLNITEGYTVSPAVFTEAGEQTVTFTFANGVSAGTTVTVEGIVLDNKELTVKTNETATLTADYCPSGDAVENAEWISSDASVATVENGVITPHKVGETVITVSDGTYTAKCKVTVISEYAEYYNPSITFEGFSIRTEGYNGLRNIFSFDNTQRAKMEEKGFELLEYGVIFSSKKNSDIYGTELTKNENGEYVTAYDKIKKISVFKNGEITGKILSGSDKNERIYFAGTIVDYTDNYATAVNVSAYSVYRDALGNEYISYAFSENEDYRYVDLYGITLDMYINGAINASNIDEEMIWSYLEAAGGVTLTAGTDYTYSEDVKDFDGNGFEGSFRYVNVPTVTQALDDNNILTFTLNEGVTLTLLEDFDTGNYVAFYRGNGIIPGTGRWTKSGAVSQLSPTFASKLQSAEGVSNVRPAPSMSNSAASRITTVIADYGITEGGYECFNSVKNLETFVYSSTFKKTASGLFMDNSTVKTVYMAQENGLFAYHEEGLADMRGISSLNTNYTFKKTNIVKIILPASVSSIGSYFATDASSLEKIWCGEDTEPESGVADFGGSGLTSVSESRFSGTKITDFIFAS